MFAHSIMKLQWINAHCQWPVNGLLQLKCKLIDSGTWRILLFDFYKTNRKYNHHIAYNAYGWHIGACDKITFLVASISKTNAVIKPLY